MPRFCHLILTRFNVKLGFDDTRIVDPAWLEGRLALFEQFCLPSVMAQTEQGFRWLVFLDEGTPPAVRKRVATLAEDGFITCYVAAFRKELRDHVARHIDPGASHLITTRLDADDALARTFVARVQARFRGQEREAVNLTDGMILGRDRLYEARRPAGAFISLIERRDGFRTVQYLRHAEWPRVAPVDEVSGPPAWLQVVHGTNVANRVTDCLRVPVARLADHFAVRYTPPPGEAALAVAAERLLNRGAMGLRHVLRPLRHRLRPAPVRPLDPLT